jgi:hypothetical protein
MRHRETGVLLYDKGHATDGYTLIVPLVSKETLSSACRVKRSITGIFP